MNLFEKIHEQAVRAARGYKKSEHVLLCAIQEVDNKKVYLRMGYKNLFEYCIKSLFLSESTTYSLIRVARKSIEIPEIQKAMEEGSLTLSHAKAIVSVINKENKKEWIEKAKTLSVRKLEKEIVEQMPSFSIPEKIKPIAQNKEKLECGLSTQTAQRIRRVQDLLSQKTKKAMSLEDTLSEVFLDYLKRHDPLEKKLSTWIKPALNSPNKPLLRTAKIHILRRDQGKCQGKDPQGNVCKQTRWLDIHHIKPISQGGGHEFSNLVTLCKGHHRLQHI